MAYQIISPYISNPNAANKAVDYYATDYAKRAISEQPKLIEAIRLVDNVSDSQQIQNTLFNIYKSAMKASSTRVYYDLDLANAEFESYFKKQTGITGRQASWKSQSALGAGTGRRPTILTSGRGASGIPAMALTKLKKQLGG